MNFPFCIFSRRTKQFTAQKGLNQQDAIKEYAIRWSKWIQMNRRIWSTLPIRVQTHLGQKTSSQLGLGPFVVDRCPGVRAVWWTSHWVSVNYMSWQETKCEWTNIWSSDTNLNCEFRAITIIISYGFDQRCMGAHSATGRLCLLLVGCWCVVHDPDLQGSRTDTPLLISRTDSADFLPKSTLLQVIPTLARYSDIASDISYGSINGI